MQRVLIDHCIGVKQQDVFSVRLTDSLIIGTCKANILLIDNDVNIRMFVGKHLQGIVSRLVIHNPHLAVNALQRFIHALQTFVQQLADVIADNDYADFLGHTKGRHSNRMTPR